ncbi:MAG TPA: hypothetical protein VK789_32380 [Bryobacteraceae bacterium]|jgi:hypothetical protein|nr:hypothetical protein [Bryobacteraceae bacterium]
MLKAISVACLVAGATLAQTPAKPAATPPMPRTADGHPDMTGVWQGGSNRPGTWEEANSGGGLGGLAPGGARPTREPAPYQDWAKAKVQESFDRRGIDDPTARCLMGGIPRTTTVGLFPMQIVQTPTQVIMLYEYFHEFRVIPLNAKHPDDLEPAYMGDSVGHWEEDTLVVDVTGFNDKTWIGPTGSFHSEGMHVVERYTRVDYNRINYDVTVEDSKVLTKPWIMHSSIMLRNGTRLREYECNEDNEDIKHYEDLLKNESVFRRK